MDIARMIDHTLLKLDATPQQIAQLCAEAREYGFAAVCVNPVYVAQAAALLAGSVTVVCSVAGFPLGANGTAAKVFETRQAIADGAREIDMVISIGHLKSGDDDHVRNDIRSVVETAHAGGAICKVIIETALLTDDEKRRACTLSVEAGADFVKTSTGFASGGATVADVTLMRAVVGDRARIKAAGGIRTLADARAMIAAGADRIGTSSGIAIVREKMSEK
ncbi:MAG: deoxyribose-phosphate aldolase [Roseiflexus castenholzii]|uniref:deoxyribose-phosphate aldolase n=1 Tax=Roseiflexus castenholzii TaxID=120962 RepID=UPI000CCA9AE6|nr:MAG: deoxyribose-phosphate aldolase [Roseiflexus castenholzii]